MFAQTAYQRALDSIRLCHERLHNDRPSYQIQMNISPSRDRTTDSGTPILQKLDNVLYTKANYCSHVSRTYAPAKAGQKKSTSEGSLSLSLSGYLSLGHFRVHRTSTNTGKADASSSVFRLEVMLAYCFGLRFAASIGTRC